MNKMKNNLMHDYQNLKTHLVKKGESLYLIAKMYNVSVEELQDLNKLATTMIYPNQLLFIPNVAFDVYITKPNDTIKDIINVFGIKLPNLGGYESLLELELVANQQINTSDGTLVYNGENLEDLLMRNNLTHQQFFDLNKSELLKKGTKIRLR